MGQRRGVDHGMTAARCSGDHLVAWRAPPRGLLKSSSGDIEVEGEAEPRHRSRRRSRSARVSPPRSGRWSESERGRILRIEQDPKPGAPLLHDPKDDYLVLLARSTGADYTISG